MGLFDLFKKRENSIQRVQTKEPKGPLPESEKKYYQPEDYYTDVVFEGTAFEKKVITFDERKKTTIPQLKELLVEHGESTAGKKVELVARVSDTISEEDLLLAGIKPKYILTDAGMQELSENTYVPYMHKAPNKTTEDARFGLTFNVWSINKLLGSGDKSNWKKS